MKNKQQITFKTPPMPPFCIPTFRLGQVRNENLTHRNKFKVDIGLKIAKLEMYRNCFGKVFLKT